MAPPPLILAIGQFDGVHCGHQAIFRETVKSAESLCGLPACLTFQPHIAQILNPAHAPLLLATSAQNHKQITACGIQQIHTMPFTLELSEISPSEFLGALKATFPSLKKIVVGENFTCGKNRAGHSGNLPDIALGLGLTVSIVPHVEHDGAPISSTRVRAAIAAGDVPLAHALLGRPFALEGTVIHGRAVGRTLGFPTANVQPVLPIRPAPGIYAAQLRIADSAPLGAAFVPDLQDPRQAHFGNVVEIYVPEFNRDIYDCEVEVLFTRRIRGHQHFDTPAAASAQIAQDVADILSGTPSPK